MLALADLGTGMCVLENEIAGGPVRAEAVATATSAPLWPAELARLVAAVRPVTDDEVRSFSRGTALDPGRGRAGVAGGRRRRLVATAVGG